MSIEWEFDIHCGTRNNCEIWQKKYDIQHINIIPNTIPDEMFYLYIYRIININDRKSYVGQAKRNIFKRWEEHLFRENSGLFHADLHSFDISDFAFKIEEVFVLPKKYKDEFHVCCFMNYRELNFIIKYDCYENGYNTHNILNEKNNPNRIRQNKKYHTAGGN